MIPIILLLTGDQQHAYPSDTNDASHSTVGSCPQAAAHWPSKQAAETLC